MLIEQIIEFELSGPGPHKFKFNITFTRTCTPTTGYFYEKNKNLYGKSSSGLLFTAEILQEAKYLNFPLPGPNHLQNLTPECKILNVFWT